MTVFIVNKIFISVPEDSDNESSSSRRSASPDCRSERHAKKLKINENKMPPSLLHFLPANVQFDPSFEPRNRSNKHPAYDHSFEDEDVPTDFILFCNHMLKQMFGVHGFDDRSLR